jgi:nitrous oxidase accessory protein NosD
MSYTLRGRLESRLAGMLPALLAAVVLAAALEEWWPLELAGIMLSAGLALDAGVYHRALPYQPGWAALPLGLLELGVVMGLARALDVAAPQRPAILFFAGAWAAAQVLGHAVFPSARWTYAEDGGELGRAGPVAAAVALGVLAAAGGVAWAVQPPTVRLEAGIHRGPLVIRSAQTLVGEPGAVVQGGILIRADGVTVRNVEVWGGENGIDVEHATGVLLDGVRVRGAELDGIHVRRSQVTIRDCDIRDPGSAHAQGIDISFAADLPASTIEGCTISGGREGILVDMTMAHVERNTVRETTLRGITMTEMSMGTVEENHVEDALGVGIFCGDYSECEIAGNVVRGTRPDLDSGDRARDGYGILAHFGAKAILNDNFVEASPGGIGAFSDATILHEK